MRRNHRHAAWYGLNILLPLAAGLALYLWLRPDAWITLCLGGPHPGPAAVPAFWRNHAADFLWAWALTFACAGVLGPRLRGIGAAALLAAAFAAALELLQKSPRFPGTFDPLDLCTEALAVSLAALWIIWTEQRRRKHEEESAEDLCPAAGDDAVCADGHGQRLRYVGNQDTGCR